MNLQLLTLDINDDDQFAIIKEAAETDFRHNRDLFEKCAAETNVYTQEELDQLRDDQFALVVMTKSGGVLKKFAIDTPQQLWLSSLYFTKTAQQLPNMAQAIAASNMRHAANVFGMEVPEVITKIAEHYPMRTNLWVEGQDFPVETEPFVDMEKVARDPKNIDERYWGLTNGKPRYPLKHPEQVKVAAQFLQRNEKAFTPEERHEFAMKIAARSHEFGINDEVDGHSVLYKYAGPGMGHGDDLKKHLGRRHQFSELDEPAPLEKTSALSKLAELGFGDRLWDNLDKRQEIMYEIHIEEPRYERLRKEAAELGPAKTAMALIHIDKDSGLSRYWDKSIDDPFAATYGKYHVKAAQEFLMFGDQQITRTELLSINAKDFESRFGISMWNEFERNPIVIFQSLPKPEQAVIASMIENPSFVDVNEM